VKPLQRGVWTPQRGRRLSGILLIASVVLDVWFVIGLAATNGTVDPVVNIWLAQVTQWVPVLVFWIVTAQTRFRRAEIVLAAAAVTLSALGDGYYSVAMGPDGYLPSPSIADVGYLLFYPLMLASLIVFMRRYATRMGRAVALDASVASLGAAALVATALDPVLRDALSGAHAAAAVVNIAYPVFDLVLIAAIIGMAAVPTRGAGGRWGSLVAGLLVFTGADIVYALLDRTGAYVAGAPLDASWAVGFTLIAWWAHGLGGSAARAKVRQRMRVRWVTLPVTAFGFVAGLAVLLIGTQLDVSLLALVLAAVTVALAAVPVVMRQALLGQLLTDQQKVIEDSERLDRSKNEMLATMNHELRTPLTSILGYVELVRDGNGGPIPSAADGMLGAVEAGALRMQKLIDDMLLMTRLDGGAAKHVPARVHLADVLADVANDSRAFAIERGVRLEFEPSDRALLLSGDREQLTRAFANLTDNAIKFSRRGGSVVVTTQSLSHPDGGVTITRISDTGMGIATDDIPQLGTRMFRASNARASAVPGAGLGLAIAQEVVVAHGGEISFESELGNGTDVRVRLPAADAG
jgi:signal transduction histidine kinase